MRLLFVTQAIDLDDPVLSVYHDWVATLAPKFESVEVICLKKGRQELPENVRVHSLGKENGDGSRFGYSVSFIQLIWKLRKEYDSVFVHMNQEYILLGGLIWKFLQKPVYLWRNHYAGSVLTDIAASFCTKVFCTSKSSYTAKYKKTVFMPVGVDTQRFTPASEIREPRSILFFARMAPSKRPELLLEAFSKLSEEGIEYTASFVGSPLKEDEDYYLSLKNNAEQIDSAIKFSPGVTNDKAPEIFQRHEIFVNCSPQGMFDKMLFEASACGSLVLTTSEDFAQIADRRLNFYKANSLDLSLGLKQLLSASPKELDENRRSLMEEANKQSMLKLSDQIYQEIVPQQNGRIVKV
ncbi:glycosyltransferase family 4 protein [Patescibacteria group bacterium]|nr:glycosyltransferase family 4 protein [Patescibacteria group bacterium]MBU1501124.1 glycosyltransferase family 4 protein [Patescibacteria group bacterium]MBU2081003.1 glycosyltransferase family 4 protein [Patescibacteria group bacterium]MBU2124095.1 glycosyltransferase family 4 protein [Patescibacteria group bacterium]MBU2194950.1 glycosyltransferase family 4 protein [Patescibacteria group bacterium]